MKYKHSYIPTIIVSFVFYFSTIICSFIFADLINKKVSQVEKGIFVFIVLVSIIIVIAFIIDVIIRMFSKEHLFMDDDVVEYKKDKCLLANIKFIEYYIGSIGRTSHTDANITMYFENNKIIRFTNPSFKLIFKLKKIVSKEGFRITGIKSIVLHNLITFIIIFILGLFKVL